MKTVTEISYGTLISGESAAPRTTIFRRAMFLRLPILVPLTLAFAFGQAPDPAYDALAGAYEALRAKAYDRAIEGFRKALEAAPSRASIHKDLAYTYLKTGENDLARDHFQEAMELDPADTQSAMEYAFLAYESKRQAEARRIFDRIRRNGDATAEEAFQNIDRPLAEGIARWREAIAMGADDFSAHYELATLAEQRDEFALAAEHYELAWRILPDRRSVLVELGRVWKALGRNEDATAALLAASRGGEPRAADLARELLPERYPYVSEFQAALRLDPANVELRRELAYLLLVMERQPEAEVQFGILTKDAPQDLLSAAQLGFLLYARGETEAAMPLLQRVLDGNDEDLANRVRAVLRVQQVAESAAAQPGPADALTMADRSIQAGFIPDAIKYLEAAHQQDPANPRILFRLGWAYNVLHQDAEAVRWFDLARHSSDPQIAAAAAGAWKNLRDGLRIFQITSWFYPMFSSRWHDLFGYGQVKTEFKVRSLFRPYISVRLIGDTRETIGAAAPQFLSESSVVLSAGVRSLPWHGITTWAEAGSALNYLNHHAVTDYRGGVSATWQILPESSGWFLENSADAIFMSRFDDDFLVYERIRIGYTGGKSVQAYWNVGCTVDSQRQSWANFGETGPGFRLSPGWFPKSMWFSVDALRGSYLIHPGGASLANFRDLRVGLWYAFSR